jgi:hypothetical protein
LVWYDAISVIEMTILCLDWDDDPVFGRNRNAKAATSRRTPRVLTLRLFSKRFSVP